MNDDSHEHDHERDHEHAGGHDLERPGAHAGAHRDEHLGDEHLGDEELSARLDGAAADAGGHLATCRRCRARRDALAAARDLVRTPVAAVPPAVRAEAVAAVLRDAETPRATGAPGATHTPRASERRAAPRSAPPRTTRRSSVALGAVAAVLVVAVVGAGVALVSHGGPTASSASRVSSNQSASHGSPSTTDLHAGADLGSVSSIGEVRTRMQEFAAVGVAGAEGKLAAPAGPAPARAAAPATTGAAPSDNVSSGAASSAAAPADVQRAVDRCLPAAERAATHVASHAAGTAVFVATLYYRGTPALAFGFAPTGNGGSDAAGRGPVVVVSEDTCGVLATAR